MQREVYRQRMGPKQLGIVIVALLTMVALLAAACGGDDATPTPAGAAPTPTSQAASVTGVASGATPTATPIGYKPIYGGIITVDLRPPTVPDPWHASSGRQWPRMFYNGLIDIKMPFNDTKGIEYEPALATEWSTSADGSKWTLKLRQGVTWHDGEAFTADDVVATWERALDPEVLIQPRQVAVRGVFKAVTKIDDHTVLMDTGEKPNAAAFTYMAAHFTSVMPDHLIRGDGTSTDVELRWKNVGMEDTGTLAIGTGPFIMKTADPEGEMLGDRNPSYWRYDELGNQLPYVDGMKYTRVTDLTRVVARFVANETHFTLAGGAGMNPRDGNALCDRASREGCYLAAFPHGFFEWVMNTTTTGQFTDPLVVAATRYASNHQEVMDLAYGGRQGFMWMDRSRFPDTALSLAEQYQLVPWSNQARRAEFEQKAIDLLVDAGYPNGFDLPQPIFGGCSGAFLDQFTRETDNFFKAGIRGTLECRQGILRNDELKAGRFSLADTPASIYLVDPALPIFSKLLLDSPAVANAPWRWEGQVELDTRFRTLLTTADETSRNEQFKDIERYMANDKLTFWAIGYTSVVAPVHGCVNNYSPGGVWDSHSFALEFVWLTPDCH